MRITITQASKLTGRDQKTLRSWLAEDPCPLSIEWGMWRGGRILPSGQVKRGRSRLLDVDELHALHRERGGTAWYAQYLPLPDVRELAARLAALERDVAALRAQMDGGGSYRAPLAPSVPRFLPGAPGASEDGDEAAPVDTGTPPVPTRRSAPAPVPLRRPTRRARPLLPGQTPLPADWTPLNHWATLHNINRRTVERVIATGRLPQPHRAPDDVPWLLRGQYPVMLAYDPEQYRIACQAAPRIWPTHLIPSCGPHCLGNIPAGVTSEDGVETSEEE